MPSRHAALPDAHLGEKLRVRPALNCHGNVVPKRTVRRFRRNLSDLPSCNIAAAMTTQHPCGRAGPSERSCVCVWGEGEKKKRGDNSCMLKPSMSG